MTEIWNSALNGLLPSCNILQDLPRLQACFHYTRLIRFAQTEDHYTRSQKLSAQLTSQDATYHSQCLTQVHSSFLIIQSHKQHFISGYSLKTHFKYVWPSLRRTHSKIWVKTKILTAIRKTPPGILLHFWQRLGHARTNMKITKNKIIFLTLGIESNNLLV
jgi:hypothetical protein